MALEEFNNFDIFTAMAWDLLAIPGSTVASESVFSTSKRVLSIRRTRFTPTSLEIGICFKDHLDAAEHIQYISSLEDPLSSTKNKCKMKRWYVEGDSTHLSDEEIAQDNEAAEARSSEDYMGLEDDLV
ncbi:zinc finger BED domain-containing protein RICESLEEPER 3 [Artemisia annua]|uniref:Zinc finger BED domain-containing protein RICESLEEPER 3 n=1 Tax=Artemisia annua TaxID=35608 RepID=A0A2U1LIC1_ARTAN|nr:zinc finger BED domain-containing protein RICESLEEPER 3 [Artemisia annua]